MSPLRFDESAETAKGDARRLAHGRSWTYALKSAEAGARGPAPREVEKAEAMGIDGRGATRATVFVRAEQLLQRGSDPAQVHSGPQDTLTTIMAARARVPHVSGAAIGRGRPMQAKEGAALMGMDLRSVAWRTAQGRMAEQQLWEAMADSVDAHMVRAMWRNCADMAEKQGSSFGGRTLRYAGMFAGALDARRAEHWPLQYVAAAELSGPRLESLGEAYRVPEGRRFSSARGMAEALTEPLDVLTATPSCKLLSAAQRAESVEARAELGRRAHEQLMEDMADVRRVAERCEPTVVMIEETAGLRSHHAALYRELQAELRSWLYEWRHGLVDCADLGAAHHRRRLLWVGVRRTQ